MEHGIPGIVVAVSRDSELLYAKGFGYSDVENCVRTRVDTVMRIASISKPLTCLLAAKLIETGRLDIDRPIDAYVSDLPAFRVDEHNGTSKITARQLMSHTSGL